MAEVWAIPDNADKSKPSNNLKSFLSLLLSLLNTLNSSSFIYSNILLYFIVTFMLNKSKANSTICSILFLILPYYIIFKSIIFIIY